MFKSNQEELLLKVQEEQLKKISSISRLILLRRMVKKKVKKLNTLKSLFIYQPISNQLFSIPFALILNL